MIALQKTGRTKQTCKIIAQNIHQTPCTQTNVSQDLWIQYALITVYFILFVCHYIKSCSVLCTIDSLFNTSNQYSWR